jgi:hypothetical protein
MSLIPLTLADMERLSLAAVDDGRLRFTVPADWPVNGETRIGYVTILRLVESVRELHWRLDVDRQRGPEQIDSVR